MPSFFGGEGKSSSLYLNSLFESELLAVLVDFWYFLGVFVGPGNDHLRQCDLETFLEGKESRRDMRG